MLSDIADQKARICHRDKERHLSGLIDSSVIGSQKNSLTTMAVCLLTSDVLW